MPCIYCKRAGDCAHACDYHACILLIHKRFTAGSASASSIIHDFVHVIFSVNGIVVVLIIGNVGESESAW